MSVLLSGSYKCSKNIIRKFQTLSQNETAIAIISTLENFLLQIEPKYRIIYTYFLEISPFAKHL